MLAFPGSLHSWTCQSLMAVCICLTLMKTLQCPPSSLLAASDRSIVIHTPVGALAPWTHTFVCQRDIFIVWKKTQRGGLTTNDWRKVSVASAGPEHICAQVIRKCLRPWPTCFPAHLKCQSTQLPRIRRQCWASKMSNITRSYSLFLFTWLFPGKWLSTQDMNQCLRRNFVLLVYKVSLCHGDTKTADIINNMTVWGCGWNQSHNIFLI